MRREGEKERGTREEGRKSYIIKPHQSLVCRVYDRVRALDLSAEIAPNSKASVAHVGRRLPPSPSESTSHLSTTPSSNLATPASPSGRVVVKMRNPALKNNPFVDASPLTSARRSLKSARASLAVPLSRAAFASLSSPSCCECELNFPYHINSVPSSNPHSLPHRTHYSPLAFA